MHSDFIFTKNDCSINMVLLLFSISYFQRFAKRSSQRANPQPLSASPVCISLHFRSHFTNFPHISSHFTFAFPRLFNPEASAVVHSLSSTAEYELQHECTAVFRRRSPIIASWKRPIAPQSFFAPVCLFLLIVFSV